MAWTEPRTWTVGEIVTAALLNTHLRDNLDSLGRDPEHIVHVGTSPFERWYPAGPPAWTTAGGISSTVMALNRLDAYPFVSPRGRTIDRIAFEVATAAGAGGVARCGIYQATSATNIYPSALVLDGGEFATTSTGVKSATVSQPLEPEILYWFVITAGVAAPTVRTTPMWWPMGMDSTLTNIGTRITVAQTYGALPATFPSGGTIDSGVQFIVAVRYSA